MFARVGSVHLPRGTRRRQLLREVDIARSQQTMAGQTLTDTKGAHKSKDVWSVSSNTAATGQPLAPRGGRGMPGACRPRLRGFARRAWPWGPRMKGEEEGSSITDHLLPKGTMGAWITGGKATMTKNLGPIWSLNKGANFFHKNLERNLLHQW